MEEKTLKLIGHFKNIVVPVVSAVVVSVIAYSEINNQLQVHAEDLSQLEQRIIVLEQTSATILQRLASIDTKLDYITKSLDKLIK